MAAITRTPIIDDDGTGTTGTVIDNAWKQQLYDQIDGLVGPSAPPTAWTPTDASGAGLAIVVGAFNSYVRQNHLVLLNVDVTWPANANGSAAKLGNLPIPPAALQFGLTVAFSGYATPFTALLAGGNIIFFTYGGVGLTNANLSGQILRLTGMYLV